MSRIPRDHLSPAEVDLIDALAGAVVAAEAAGLSSWSIADEVATFARFCQDVALREGRIAARRRPRRREVTSGQALRTFRRDEWTCRGCGSVGGDLTVDHVIPVSKGGTNDDGNLQTMCRSCNSRKRDHLAVVTP